MEMPKKKSKAFIVTFIIVIILLIAGYFLFVNKGVFGTKGSTSSNKDFESLATTEGQTGLDKIDSGSKSGSIADFIASLFRKGDNTDSNSNPNTNSDNTNSNNSGDANSTNSGINNSSNSGSTNNSGSNFKPGSSDLGDFGNFEGGDYVNGSYNNSNSIPNPGSYTGSQTNFGNITDYDRTGNTETPDATTPETNNIDACLIIDENPLTFTASEKAELDDLLRKFYIIASSLRTEGDIALAYSQLKEYEDFISQVETLTSQCYSELASVAYTGPRTQYGNPWYKYNDRGSYINGTINSYCKYGEYYTPSTTTSGIAYIPVFNQLYENLSKLNNPNYETTPVNSEIPYCSPEGEAAIKNGEGDGYNYWGIPAFNSPVDTSVFEKILNIW